jgi:hypothetical protein
MALKIAVTAKSQAPDNPNDSGRISVKACCHGSYTEKDVVARMFQYWADNLLALGTKEFNSLRK